MNKYCLRAALVAALSSVAGHSVAADIDARYQQGLQSSLQKHMPSLLEVYRDLHQHPELGLEEVRTAGVLTREMRKLGFTVTEKVGKTGVVAIYKNGEGPLVMVRADMDGLPVQELSGLPYASTAKAMYNRNETPLMHACGHDIHMATWVGTAKALLDQKDKWKGTLMFVGQPAEEGRGGAKAMMDDRIFERFGLPDYAFAFHVVPAPWNSVQLVKGAVTSYAGGFNITFKGRGGHGSRPNTTIDPVVMAGKFVADVQSVISRELDPQKFGVISIGRLAAGNAGNVIPDAATVSGTFRWYEPEVGHKLAEGIERTARSIVAQAAAPEAQISVISGDTTVINDPALTDATLLALKKVDGIRALETTPEYWSEDYGEFLRDFTSSVYMRVGGFDPALFKPDLSPIGDNVPSNHSPYFVPVPEPTLRTAVTAMTTAVFNVLAE